MQDQEPSEATGAEIETSSTPGRVSTIGPLTIPPYDPEEAKRNARIGENWNMRHALGDYIVRFSRLVGMMRLAMEYRLGGERTRADLAALALGAAPPDQIRSAFFAMCRYQLELDGIPLTSDETKVANKLEKLVKDTIEERNKIAHADWLLASERVGEQPLTELVRPSSKTPFQVQTRSADDLQALNDAMHELTLVVAEYGEIALGQYRRRRRRRVRVGDLLVIKRGKVVREGPLAAAVKPL